MIRIKKFTLPPDSFGGLAAAATYGIGHSGVPNGPAMVEDHFLRGLAHGAAQGAIAEMRGGKFKDGFLSGAVGHWAGVGAGKYMKSLDGLGKTAVAAMAGEVASVAGGGKFKNGAVTAAFVHLFNQESGKLEPSEFNSQNEAAEHALNKALPLGVRDNVEYGGQIYRNEDGSYGYTGPAKGAEDWIDPASAGSIPDGAIVTAEYHTHGRSNSPLSVYYDPINRTMMGDIPRAVWNQVDMYLITPKNGIQYFDHNDPEYKDIR